jgi:dTDP-glucose 4,6-dehydratase
MLARAWQRTYGLPVVISNSANNYGPWQHPEKFIPTVLLAAMRGGPIPIFGDGSNIRDWLHVDDHAAALLAVLERGRVGERYCIGGGAERSNIALARALCRLLDEQIPAGAPHEQAIAFVTDRPGHDWRYALDSRKIRGELGWEPRISLEDGLRGTVRWHVENQTWLEQTAASQI